MTSFKLILVKLEFFYSPHDHLLQLQVLHVEKLELFFKAQTNNHSAAKIHGGTGEGKGQPAASPIECCEFILYFDCLTSC